MPEKYIDLGHISGCHGVKGWLRVYSDTEPLGNIFSYKEWRLSLKNNFKTIKVLDSKANGKKLIVRLEGVDNRNEAEDLVGAKISINTELLAELDENEYYWRDLIGLNVVNTENESLGIVQEMLTSAAHDILLVINSAKKRILIPYTFGVHVLSVNLEAKTITVDWYLD